MFAPLWHGLLVRSFIYGALIGTMFARIWHGLLVRPFYYRALIGIPVRMAGARPLCRTQTGKFPNKTHSLQQRAIILYLCQRPSGGRGQAFFLIPVQGTLLTWPPISPIMTIPLVSGSLVNLSRQSMKFVPLNGSPPIPTQVLCPIPENIIPGKRTRSETAGRRGILEEYFEQYYTYVSSCEL